MRSVSKLTMSPRSMARIEHSRNQGLVRGPEDSSRVSIHSPPRRDVGLVQLGPERVLGDAGLRARRASTAMPASQTSIGLAHQHELFGRLDLARVLHDLEALLEVQTLGAQRIGTQVREPVDREALVAAAVAHNQVGDLVGKPVDPLLRARARGEVVEGLHRPVLVHGRHALGEVRVIAVVEQHHGTSVATKAHASS